jgi:branched-chain amino acid transport system substrate-binding protein
MKTGVPRMQRKNLLSTRTAGASATGRVQHPRNQAQSTALNRSAWLRFALAACGVAAMALLASKGAAQGPASAGAAGVAPLVVRIGHAGPTSGPIAHLGRDNEMGALLAVEEINASNDGRGLKVGDQHVKLELVAADDEADPRKGAIVAQQLVAAGVLSVVGHLNSGVSIPASFVYAQAGVIQISPSSTNPFYTRRGVPTAFRLATDDAVSSVRLARHVWRQGFKRAYVMNDGTVYGGIVANEFAKAFKAMGGTLADDVVIKPTGGLQAAAETVARSNADVFVYGGMDHELGPMLKTLRSVDGAPGRNMLVVGGDGICSPALIEMAGASIGDVRCYESPSAFTELGADAQQFAQRFRARFGVDVQVYSPYSFDAVHVLAQAMVRAASIDKVAVLQAMRTTQHEGVTGPISFDDKGDVLRGATTIYSLKTQTRRAVEVLRE